MYRHLTFLHRKNACWGAPKPSGTSGHDEAADKVPNSDVLGLDLLDRVPDHSPVSQLRWRKPSFGKSFRRLFEEIVRQCVPNGPVTGRLGHRLYVKANASRASEELMELQESPGNY